jgi:hypothetical protein
MSLIWADPGGGFYSTIARAVSGGYWTALTATIKTSGLPSGNIEPTALRINNLSGQITVPSSPGTYTFGFRICNDQNPYNSTQNVCKFLDPSSATQLSFSTVSGGAIAVTLGDTATLLETSSGTNLSQNVWSYVELQMLCSATVGTVAIRINGSTVLNLTGQNTKGSGTTTNIGSIKVGSNITPLFQDLYITTSSGSHNTGFLGDVQMPISLANANGTYTAWTPNGAGTIYQSVNASTPADSTVFASDSTSVTGNIVGVCHMSRMLKSTSGTRTVSQTITNGGSDQIASAVALGTSYGYFLQVSETDPNTGLPYTQSGFNTIQTGVETVS